MTTRAKDVPRSIRNRSVSLPRRFTHPPFRRSPPAAALFLPSEPYAPEEKGPSPLPRPRSGHTLHADRPLLPICEI
jgi:hypothetical protein